MLDPVTRMIAASRRAGAAERPAGAVLYLCTLGLVAAATIGAFFGLGLALLMPHPIAHADRQTASAMAPGASAATARHTLPAATSAPAVPSGFAGRSTPAAMAAAPSSAAPAVPAAPVPAAPVPAAPVPAATVPAAPVSAAPAFAAKPQRPAAIAALLEEGDELFHNGDIAAARLRYRQAFDFGAARGALGIGATYDFDFLNRDGRHGLTGDPAVASFWYREAFALGAAEAERRLAALPAAPPR